MEQIAFIIGDTFLYWSQLLLVLGAVAAVGFYGAVYLGKGGSFPAFGLSVLLSLCAGVPLARLIHWYCRTPAYESFYAAMTDYSQGEYALMGVFAGCALAACAVRLLGLSRDLPRMLDSMAIGGGIGIAVGRLGSLFDSSCRGMLLPEQVGFPFAWRSVNAVSGAVENRLATFMLQSILTAALVAALLLYMLLQALRRKKLRRGDVCLMFLLVYCACQMVTDSTRTDSLFFRSNGFVSIVQVAGLVVLLVPLTLFSVRMVRRWGLKLWQLPIWAGMLGLLGLAGYMEYYVQRHGNEAAMAYSVMSASVAAVVVLGFVTRYLGEKEANTQKGAAQ